MLFGRMSFIERGTKQSITDRLGREVLQQCKLCGKIMFFFEHSSMKTYSGSPQKQNQNLTMA